jgi:hypothetical protein
LQINFDYVPRLQLAIEWALESNFLVNLKRTKDITENDLVYLPKFVNWAITKQNWEMPIEFRAMASVAKSDALMPIKASNKRGRRPSLTEGEIAKLIQMRIDKPMLSHDLFADECGVSRRYVGGLLKKHGIN